MGELIKAKAREEVAEMAKNDENARARARQAATDTAAANDVLLAFKAMEKERDRQAARAIEEYAAKKQAMADERKRREGERAAAKEAQRQRMVAIMEKQFSEAQAKTEERVEAQVKEADLKRAAREEAEAAKRRAMQAEIDRFCRMQLNQKAASKAAQSVADRDFSAAWAQRLHELKEEEEAEVRDRRARAKQTADIQKWQSGVKSKRAAATAIAARQEAWQTEAAVAEQDSLFNEYAAETLREYAAKGRNLKPMTLMLEKKEKLQGLI
jgi:hypothetical protein